MRRRNRDARGVVVPARLMVFSIAAVALAGLVFVATQGSSPDKAAEASHHTTPTSTPTAAPTQAAVPTPTASPTPVVVVKRGKTNVVVFNNSNVKGLAGKTATRIQAAGWNVVATDNWYGTVDASTVYFGPKLKPAAELLAADLGIARVRPAIAPMQFNRLTVILTADYH